MILITDPPPATDTATDILFRSTTYRLASHCRSPVVSGSYLNWKRLPATLVLLGANEMSGSVARNVSGFGVRHGAILKPGTLVTGNPEDEIRRDIHGLAGEASDASRGSAVTGGM